MASDSSNDNAVSSHRSPKDGSGEGAPLHLDQTSFLDPASDSQTIVFSVSEDVSPVSGGAFVQKEYTFIEQIARGGMGRIFSATDSVLEREVAVKVSVTDSKGTDSRFRREGLLLAKLAHPNIVPIYNIGKDSEGRPFYSMKMIRGRTFMQVIRALANGDAATLERYSLLRLLSVFRKVCDAVAFAHSKGYLHRDIKPENVMLGEYGEVLLMDWGLAQAISNRPNSAEVPEDNEIPKHYIEGTPEYMSPEQTRGETLDERSDIYSLGGMLHALLSYGPPVRGKTLPELLLKVQKGELQPIKRPRGSASKADSRAPRLRVPTALQAVTRKAMALKREHRYQNVREMLQDIEAFQNGFATAAEQAGVLRQVLLLFRRHSFAFGAVALFLISVVLFTVRLAASEREAKRSAALAQEEARNSRLSADEARKQTSIAQASAQAARDRQEDSRRSAAAAQMVVAEAADEDSNGWQTKSALDQVPEDLRDQNWHYINGRLDTSDLQVEAEEGGAWKDCVPHPLNTNLVLTLQANGWIRSLNLSTGVMQNLFMVSTNSLKNRLAVSPDGKRVAVYRRLKNPEMPSAHNLGVDVYSLENSEHQCHIEVPIFRVLNDSEPMCFSPDGNSLLVSSVYSGNGICMFDAVRGTLRWRVDEDADAFAGFSERGTVMMLSRKSGFTERDLASGAVLNSAPKAFFQARSNHIATPSWDAVFFTTNGGCRKMEIPSGKFVANFPVKGSIFFTGDLAILPETEILAVLTDQAQQSASLELWDVKSNSLMRSVPMVMPVGQIKSSEDARWAVVAVPQSDHFVVIRGTHLKVWRVTQAKGKPTFGIASCAGRDSFAFLKDADSFVSAFSKSTDPAGLNLSIGRLGADTLASKKPLNYSLSFGDASAFAAGVSADAEGRLLCASFGGDGSSEHELKLSKVDSGAITEIAIPLLKPLPGHFHLSPDGKRIWAGKTVLEISNHAVVRVDRGAIVEPEMTDRAPRWLGNSHVAEIALVLNPAAGLEQAEGERQILLWDAISGKCSTSTSAQNAVALSASPDGRQLAEGGSDKKVRIRDGATLAIQKQLRVHDGRVLSVAWHPKLPFLATASADHTVRIWDLTSDTLIEEFSIFQKVPDRLFWSPDGTKLAVRIRDAGTSISVFRPRVCEVREPSR